MKIGEIGSEHRGAAESVTSAVAALFLLGILHGVIPVRKEATSFVSDAARSLITGSYVLVVQTFELVTTVALPIALILFILFMVKQLKGNR